MTSSPPNVSIAAPTKRSGKPWSVTLPFTAPAAPPADLISSATARPGSSSASLTTTLAPCRANLSAMARPMPRPEPETRATLFFKFCISNSSDGNDGFAGELDLALLILGSKGKPHSFFAHRFEQLGDIAFARQLSAELRNC